jgi:hypothetical protein
MIHFQCANSFEIYLKDEHGKNHTVQSYVNRTYQMPLYQTRHINIRFNIDDLRRDGRVNNKEIVGFKLQVQSTDARVIEIEKELVVPSQLASNKQLKKILVEDLFIRKSTF